MGMKRFVHSDGKYAWYNEEKHKLVDGELVLLKASAPVVEEKKEEKPRRRRRG